MSSVQGATSMDQLLIHGNCNHTSLIRGKCCTYQRCLCHPSSLSPPIPSLSFPLPLLLPHPHPHPVPFPPDHSLFPQGLLFPLSPLKTLSPFPLLSLTPLNYISQQHTTAHNNTQQLTTTHNNIPPWFLLFLLFLLFPAVWLLAVHAQQQPTAIKSKQQTNKQQTRFPSAVCCHQLSPAITLSPHLFPLSLHLPSLFSPSSSLTGRWAVCRDVDGS